MDSSVPAAMIGMGPAPVQRVGFVEHAVDSRSTACGNDRAALIPVQRVGFVLWPMDSH